MLSFDPIIRALLDDVLDRFEDRVGGVVRTALKEHGLGRVNPEYWTVRRLAKAISTSEKTVRRRILAGRIRASKVGNRWRIPAEEVDRVLRDATL